MVRTRGGSSQGGLNEDRVERRRPTASARRGGVVIDDEAQAQAVPDIPAVAPQIDPAENEDGFPGGPRDTSILLSYVDHVACQLWTGEDRGELKLVSHGKMLRRFGLPCAQIQGIVYGSGLGSLVGCSLVTADKGLLSAFVERWHRETSSFHLPIGEMTVTLDDVSSLLHLPITGAFYTYEGIDSLTAVEKLVELLGVRASEARAEIQQCRGPHVRLQWLRDVYVSRCSARQWTEAARAYLLHLVGCTIFANKSGTFIGVVCLELFRELDECSTYAWGAAALTHLYEHLSDGSMHRTRQLGGYVSLLQTWIYEHFPSIGARVVVDDYQETAPRATRWVTGLTSSVAQNRRKLDSLTGVDVCWMPYQEHRVARQFEDISLFSGYIRWGPTFHRHMPERVLRQYGFVQTIPRHPRDVRAAPLAPQQMDDRWLHFSSYLAETGDVARYPSECVAGYVEWYYSISHPYVIGPEDGEPPRPPPVMFDPVAVAGQDRGDAVARFRRIADNMERIVNIRMVARGTEAYSLVEESLQLARGVTQPRNVYNRRVRRTMERGQSSGSTPQ